jgi:hypothetical protein
MPIFGITFATCWRKLGLFGLLALAIAIQSWRLDDWRDQARTEAAAHALTIGHYRQAQDAAANLATEAKQKKESADETARQASDADYDVLRARYWAAIDKLRRQAASARPAPGQPDLPGTSQATEGVDRSGNGAGISISEADALICADNTARLQAARDWALKVAAP